MSGVAVLRYLLANNAGILAVCPATRIMTGDLPLGTTFPAISLQQISSVPRNFIRINAAKVHDDRVQVTVIFEDSTGGGSGYPGVKSLLALVLAACPSQYGTVNGIAVQSIAPDVEQAGAADIGSGLVSGSRDFLVRWASP